MRLGRMLAISVLLACSGDEGSATWVDVTSAPEGCDPNAVEEWPPGTARIDGCPGSSPRALAATWAKFCADNPDHERCPANCRDAGSCPTDE